MLTRTTKTALLGLALLNSACSLTEQRPEMTSVQDSISQAQERPVITSDIILPRPAKPEPGSLWKPGAKQFFKDSRAHQVGDILTVLVSESATAETEANTETTRSHDSESGLTNLLNVAGKLTSRGIATGAGGLLDTESNRTFTGEGSTDRSDTITARVAAIVTQVLPNGYLVIQGKRELVVNYELQELNIKGIVRPEDISAGNTVESDKIAEARIFYAGRGVVDESQAPQYGVRFIDRWMPF